MNTARSGANRRIRATLGWTTSLLLAACSGGGGGGGGDVAPPPVTPPPVTPPPSPPVGGLDQRPSNTTCLAPDRAVPGTELRVVRVFPQLTFSSPVGLLQAPQDASRWFVIEQAGVVRTFPNDPGASASSVFIDIRDRVRSGGEMGLLGMAFHPQFAQNGRVFLSYTTGTNPLVSRISEFLSRDGGLTLDPASERVLLTVVQPETNHNGGGIVFGPQDGYLYIGLGDGGSGGDPHGPMGNGQNLQTLLGKMLRIDVDRAERGMPYGIPADNPFAANAPCGDGGTGSQNCPEIHAWGFRNPWRWSFDRATGELWVGDVGQNAWEEIDRVVRGGNYGWRCREGAHPFNASCGGAQNLIDPVAEYGRAAGFSVTGGYVYRGTAIPSLQGRYVFGDLGGAIWNIARDTQPTLEVTAEEALESGLQITSFGEGLDGELYVVHYGGTLHRLEPATGGGADPVPLQLSATGCVDTSDPTRPASGLIPYAPNAPFWSDGADKERWMALPDGQRIAVGNDGDWGLPAGSVLVKHFRLGTRLVETRLLMRHPDGEWAGYTYQWNAQQTEATRVIGGKTAQIDGYTWIFPSERQCLACHTEAAGRTLGLETAQLNGELTYPQTGRTANQLQTLNGIQLLTPQLTGTPDALPALADPYGTAGTLDARARAYLHTNCAQCHRPGGGTGTDLDLRHDTPLAATGACNVVPQRGDLGIANALVIAPGDSARSVLVARMDRRDAAAMPPLASLEVDAQGVALVAEWIDSLSGCGP